jgi:hypothetical protein
MNMRHRTMHRHTAARSPARLISLVLLSLSGPVWANIGIKPAFVEVTMDKGRPAGSFFVANLGEKEERFRINAVHFTYSETGVLRRSQKGDHSLAPWIFFNPRELTLPPKTSREPPVAVVAR